MITVTTEEINAYIEKQGKGNVRDALNVALADIKRLEKLLANVGRGYYDCITCPNCEGESEIEIRCQWCGTILQGG